MLKGEKMSGRGKYTVAVAEAQKRYRASGAVRSVSLQFNVKRDADILEHLDAQKNRQGYIKTLIRADMQAKNASEDGKAATGAECRN